MKKFDLNKFFNSLSQKRYNPVLKTKRRVDLDFLQAVDEGRLSLVTKLLKEGANVNSAYEDGTTTLALAAKRGNTKILKLLLKNGADPDLKDSSERTPLTWAAIAGRTQSVKILIAAGCQLENKDYSGQTAVSCAAGNGHADILQMLIKAKCNVNTESVEGWTPLHKAIHRQHIDTIKILLDNGANVNANSSGNTPIMFASANGWADIVKLLLSYNADLTIRNDKGKTAYDMAVEFKHEQVMKLLQGPTG